MKIKYSITTSNIIDIDDNLDKETIMKKIISDIKEEDIIIYHLAKQNCIDCDKPGYDLEEITITINNKIKRYNICDKCLNKYKKVGVF